MRSTRPFLAPPLLPAAMSLLTASRPKVAAVEPLYTGEQKAAAVAEFRLSPPMVVMAVLLAICAGLDPWVAAVHPLPSVFCVDIAGWTSGALTAVGAVVAEEPLLIMVRTD